MDKSNKKDRLLRLKQVRKKTIQPPAQIRPDGLYRLNQFIPHFIPVGKSTWWLGVKSGKFPSGRKLGPRTRVWQGQELLEVIQREDI